MNPHFTNHVERENAFGRELWDAAQYLGLRRPEFSGVVEDEGYDIERWTVTMVIFGRAPPSETRAIRHTVVGYSWKSALLHAAKEGLQRVCYDYRRELSPTYFRYYGRMSWNDDILAMRQDIQDEDLKTYRMANHIQNVECYAQAAKDALDDLREKYAKSQEENERLRQDYNKLSRRFQIRCGGPTFKRTARKSVRPQEMWFDYSCLGPIPAPQENAPADDDADDDESDQASSSEDPSDDGSRSRSQDGDDTEEEDPEEREPVVEQDPVA